MQTDMHYYGTYAMARCAGLNSNAAQSIADAAEYVDDSDYVAIQLADQTFLDAPPTAHHPENKQNLLDADQRRVWVPFHFLPGNQGETFEEKLICRKDSEIARHMVIHYIGLENLGFNVELMGIAAHVYADTFSHYGFSGIASDLNQVYGESIELDVKSKSIRQYISEKTEEFKETYIKGAIGNAVKLGHGGVSTYPDRPHLRWRFTYESGMRDSGWRENQKTFLEACEKLHAMFTAFGANNEFLFGGDGKKRSFGEIKSLVTSILAVEGSMEERIAAWQRAAKSGELFGLKEEIQPYDDHFAKDVALMQGHNKDSITGCGAYAFLRAAKFHRDFVLDELLPKHGLRVVFRA